MKSLGKGVNGSVYCTARTHDKGSYCKYAIKIQHFNAVAKQEVLAYSALRKSGIVPKLHAVWKCRGKLYMVMDFLTTCKPKPKLEQVRFLLTKLEKLGWLHVDTHSGNLLCDSKGQVKLIDFGWAIKKGQAVYNHLFTIDRSLMDAFSLIFVGLIALSTPQKKFFFNFDHM